MTASPQRRPRQEVLRGQRSDEPYLYWRFLVATVRPGAAVPLLRTPQQPQSDPGARTIDEQTLIIEEGRQQLTRQGQAMQQNQTRAATLLTITVAELVYLATAGLQTTKSGPWLLWLPLGLSASLAMLALGGAVSVLTARAVYGTVNLPRLIDGTEPIKPALAREYACGVSVGDETNAARLTVLRDAVLLAVLAGLCLLVLLAAQSGKADQSPAPVPATSSGSSANRPATNVGLPPIRLIDRRAQPAPTDNDTAVRLNRTDATDAAADPAKVASCSRCRQ